MKAKIEKLDTVNQKTEENGIVDMQVKKMIGYSDFVSAVNSIANGCFNEETGEVLYEVVDFIERAEVIERYTDYQLPDDIDEAFDVIYGTNVYEQACGVINEGQLIRLFAAAEAKMEAMEKRANAELTSGIQNAVAKFEQLSEQMETAFGGVTPEQVNGVFSAMADGTFDEEKIVDAVMKATAKKDDE